MSDHDGSWVAAGAAGATGCLVMAAIAAQNFEAAGAQSISSYWLAGSSSLAIDASLAVLPFLAAFLYRGGKYVAGTMTAAGVVLALGLSIWNSADYLGSTVLASSLKKEAVTAQKLATQSRTDGAWESQLAWLRAQAVRTDIGPKERQRYRDDAAALLAAPPAAVTLTEADVVSSGSSVIAAKLTGIEAQTALLYGLLIKATGLQGLKVALFAAAGACVPRRKRRQVIDLPVNRDPEPSPIAALTDQSDDHMSLDDASEPDAQRPTLESQRAAVSRFMRAATKPGTGRLLVSDLHAAYSDWAVESQSPAIGRTWFGRVLKEQGFSTLRTGNMAQVSGLCWASSRIEAMVKHAA